MSGRMETRLAELGVALPRPPKAIGNFAYGIEHAGLLYLSGTYGTTVGRGGQGLSADRRQGRRQHLGRGGLSFGRLMAINHLAMAKAVIGDLDRIDRVIRLIGFVNAAPASAMPRAC